MNISKHIKLTLIFLIIAGCSTLYAQKPHKVGTTTAAFLEIGYGSSITGMGDAGVSIVNDLSSVYWNPAGLAFMKKNQAHFSYQPWIVDINTSFTGAAIVLPNVGAIALSIIHAGYGSMDVTTLEMQEGTGEKFSAGEYAINLTYARKLAQWFSFGATAKYISSKIWHVNANAFALDLGVQIHTNFFSVTGKRKDGMKIGMSIANYGSELKYSGIDMLNPIDILPEEEGNYKYVPGQFRMSSWQLPLIFRIGIALQPIATARQKLLLTADALHTNNSDESVNLGSEYSFNAAGFGTFFLRCGYKALFLDNSQYGMTYGGGLLLNMMNNNAVKIDYAYRNTGVFGYMHTYSIGIIF